VAGFKSFNVISVASPLENVKNIMQYIHQRKHLF